MLTRLLESISIFICISLMRKPLRCIRRFALHPIWRYSPTRILETIEEHHLQADERRYAPGEVYQFLRSYAPPETRHAWSRRVELDRRTTRIHLKP